MPPGWCISFTMVQHSTILVPKSHRHLNYANQPRIRSEPHHKTFLLVSINEAVRMTFCFHASATLRDVDSVMKLSEIQNSAAHIITLLIQRLSKDLTRTLHVDGNRKEFSSVILKSQQ